MESNITDNVVSQMCRKFEDHKKSQMGEFKSLLESTFGTYSLRQQADRNTAAMVARGVDTTRSTTTESTSNPETFTETTESGLEMSEDTEMIIDNNEKDKSLLIDGLEDTIPKNQKHKIQVTAEITTATHSIGVSGATVSSGEAVVDVDMVPVDVETDPESERAEDNNNASVNLDNSKLEALGNDQELDPETINKYLEKSQSDDEVSKLLFIYITKLQSTKRLNFKNPLPVISIILFIIGRITNQRTLSRRKKNFVQFKRHACNMNTNISCLSIINSLYVHLRTKIYLFSLIYVYMFYLRVSFNTVYKNHKPIKNKLNTCNPSRLEFSNKSPVEDKEKTEISQKKSQNLDKAVYPLLDEMPGGKLDVQLCLMMCSYVYCAQLCWMMCCYVYCE